MKIRSLIPRFLRHKLNRWFKLHPLVERYVTQMRRVNEVCLPGHNVPIKLQEGDVVLDIGANIGEISSLLAMSGAEIHAFEPDPHAFVHLNRRFGYYNRVKCYNKGVMDEASTLRLYFCKPDAKDRVQASIGSSFHEEKNIESVERSFIKVECINLNRFLFDLGRPIALIKMDIEGAEVQVINSMLDSGSIRHVRQMLVESHEKQIPSLQEGMDRLRQRIRDEGYEKIVDLNWM